MISLALMAAAAALQPVPILTIDPKHRIVEGIASDGTTIWVSSLVDRKILACTTASCRTLVTLPAGLHPFAITWDTKRDRLWVAADCPPGVSFIKACERGALLAYDKSGKLKTRIASSSGAFHPGDVSAFPTGVYVSDSQSGAVYQLSTSGQSLEPIVATGVGKSAQGSALDLDGRTLIVADYSKGIAAVDLVDGTRTLLPRAGDKPLRGIDGMVRCGNTYYGVYNGAAPGTLLAIQREGKEISIAQPLGDLTLPDPTQVALVGQRLLVVADAGWATIGKKDFVRTQGTPIYAIDLAGDCTVG
jgi:hypothetical protein